MGDSSELTLALATNGVAHPTGYPLYTLLGHFFCVLLHSLGLGWSPAASWWSVVGAGVAFFFLASLAREWMAEIPDARPGVRILAPLAPLLLFAFQPVVLGEATRAEVNTWSLAWAAGASFVFVRLARSAGRAPDRWGAQNAFLWGLICGLGLAHHLTSVLIMAPLSAGLLVLLARRGALRISTVPIACAAALLPLLSYLWIAWRAWHPAIQQWPFLEPSWSSVIDHLRARTYRGFLGSFRASSWSLELLARAVYPFLFPGLLLLTMGQLRARTLEQRISWIAILTSALAVAAFAFFYGVEDPTPYFLAPMGLGVAAAAPWLASLRILRRNYGTVGLLAASLAALTLIVPWIREGWEERAATITFEQVIRSMWSSIPPDTAIVSWTDDRYNRLLEYQVLRKEKPALLVVTPDVLLGGRVRGEIIRRFGVDPRDAMRPIATFRGAGSEQDALAAARQDLIRRLNERVRVPVILFDPKVPIVWQYRKPWESR